MSRKRRKSVENEADLKNSDRTSSGDVEDGGLGGQPTSNNESNPNNDEENKPENPSSNNEQNNNQGSDEETGTEPQQNQPTDPNEADKHNGDQSPNESSNSDGQNQVFDGNPNDIPANNQPSNVENHPNNLQESNNQNENSNDESANDNTTNQDTEDENGTEESDSQNDESDNNKDSDSNTNQEQTNDKNTDKPSDSISVTDTDSSSDKQGATTNMASGDGLLGKLEDKVSEYSQTASTLQHAKKFNDLKNMSKAEAKQEVIEMGKLYVKQKAIELFMAYVAPYLIPILLTILAIILVIMIIVAAIIGATSSHRSPEDCDDLQSNSTDVNLKNGDAKKNAETIFKYEMKKVDGAKAKAVAAHLGNLYVESGGTFDPKTVQGNKEFKESLAKDESVSGYALGIAQWDGARRANLLKFAEKKDKKWSNFGVQLDFLLNHDGSDSDVIKKLLKKDGSVGSITGSIMNEWERAGDKSSLSKRKGAASKYYSKFGKKDIGSSDDNIDDATDAASDNSDADKNSSCGSDDSKTTGKLGDSVKANGDSGKLLKDWDSKDEIPEKYKKHIKVPDFKESILNSSENPFKSGLKGQCTELTYGYMKQLYSETPPTSGNGNVLYKSYKSKGAKVTSNPTVGYGFSANPPYAGAGDPSTGHTGVVVGVLDDGKWIMANYNLHGEGNNGQKRSLTYALIDGNKKKDGVKFFSGIGKSKVKSD